MTYRRYAAGSSVSNQGRWTQPPSLRYAVRLMVAGAGVALIGTILTIAVGSTIRSEILTELIKDNASSARHGTGYYTIPQLHQWAHGIVIAFVLGEILIVGLWAWMAWANDKGMGWARITSSVLFGLITFQVLRSLRWTNISFLFLLLEWLIGLAAVVLLWRHETSEYFGPG
jgi:hypothetical protein